ncbi:MAG: hypothetical protein GXP48_09255 [Acidobacteria bacterium]|nr:hypothetical protein [Acidobacteriota bacterium]
MTPEESTSAPAVIVGLNAVILAVTDEHPRVLTVSFPTGSPIEGGGRIEGAGGSAVRDGLPTGPLDPAGDRTLELALRRWVRAYAGIELGYVEQLYTFGDRFRDPRERSGGPRVISVAYLALVRESTIAGHLKARWRGVYEYLPWEDWREGVPGVLEGAIAPVLRQWLRGDREEAEDRRERAGVTFGLDGAPWNGERVLERYELLFETGLVAEASRDAGNATLRRAIGREMAFDHRRILATALGRLRGKIRYRPVVFELVPETFTLLQLQRTVEALAGVRLHKQNFRRLVDAGGLVEGTGLIEPRTGGRPAELFRFRREVLRERQAPGVGLPGAFRKGVDSSYTQS